MKSREEGPPRVSLYRRQRGIALDLPSLRSLANAALPLCLTLPGTGNAVLDELEEVAVVLVSDRVIAQIHQRFMQIPGATDVITFAHGEVVVSLTTAARESKMRSEPLDREVLRYVVHGLLHLNGHEDIRPEDAVAMWETQEAVVAELWAASGQYFGSGD